MDVDSPASTSTLDMGIGRIENAAFEVLIDQCPI
jgi:hypothetical protein